MKNKKKIILYIAMIIVTIFISITIYYFNVNKESSKKYVANINHYKAQNTNAINENDKTKQIYISDIPYNTEKSFAVNGHTIHLDENDSNDLITLKVNDKSTPFIKGICAWATSEMVYDLQEYNYDYFTSYLGVDISEQSNYFNTGVKFYIYTSSNGEDWEEKLHTDTLYGWSEAQYVKIDIKNVKYLKLVADDNSDSWWANWYDEAVYADAKLIKEDYKEDMSEINEIKTVSEYDEIIKKSSIDVIDDFELTLLQREFVNNVGYDVLQSFVRYSDEYKETVLWLMNDSENLRLYLAGGKPEGSYLNSLKVLAKLYTTHKEDLENKNVTKYGTKLSDLYRTMMFSISLTHSGNVYLWIDGMSHSDPVTRYEIYKKLYLHEGQENELIQNKTFESLTVEEMRWVMNTVIDDEEIEWLNDYTRNVKNGATGPYSYIKYTFGYDYDLDKYYDTANYSEWDKKYNLSKYNITYKKGQPKLWIVFEEGSVCGGLSKTGSCIWGAYKGLPNTCVSQPGHCAYIYYDQNKNGDGIWNLGNDVSGWGQSGRTEHLNVRTMNDWGNGNYTSGWNASYILLGQAAQNEYKKYEKSEEILMLASVYNNDTDKLEKIYRKALETENINFDAWLGLVNLYLNDNKKTEEDYYNLAEEIANTLKYYPKPMYDLLTMISPKFESSAYSMKYTLLKTRTLTDAKNATDEDTIQVTAVRQVANTLLGSFDSNIAKFSFDGENAGAIVLSDQYGDSDVQWDYSLDGGKTWNQTGEHIKKLTSEELKSITAENDIKVHIIGVDYSESNIYTIDIKESAGLPADLYANDLENRIIGATSNIEWRYSNNDEWQSYGVVTPDLTGNKEITIRAGSTETYLPSNETITYKFTEDNQPDNRKYIPISYLSIADVSSEEPGHNGSAQMAIDGNINTRWHNNWSGNDKDKYITIKLDSSVYLSAVQYVPIQSETPKNGMFKDVILYVSSDGENWTEVAKETGWAANGDPKTIELKESVEAQYIKIHSPVNYSQSGGTSNFATAAMINLFEDTTKKVNPTAGLKYNITELTNQDVTVTLVDPSTSITITNNDGKDSYVFTQNGEFTFEFVDEFGNTGSKTAKVDWIDKIIPTATIHYNITEKTTKEVTATISDFSEEVTIINNSGNDVYTFTENGSFEFQFKDKAGNIGKATAKVDWIIKQGANPDDKNPPSEDDKPSIDDKDLYLESESYKKDDTYLYRIKPNTTLKELKSNLKTNESAIIKVYKKNQDGTEVELGEDELIGTGMRLIDKLGSQEISLIISVIGDIDGNGTVTATDIAEISNEFLEPNLKGERYLSADIEENKEITATDIAEAIDLFF